MVSVSPLVVYFRSSLFFVFSSSYSNSSSSFSSLSDLEAASDPRSAIFAVNVLSSAASEESPSRITASTRNDSRRTAFRYYQTLIFFERVRSPMVVQRSNSVTGMQIFLPVMAKARSASMETTVGDSRDPAMAKSVTVFLR